MSLDWFRRTTWSPEDETDFFARLRRARPHNRSQYLRIQAWHLEEAGTRELLSVALHLLDLLLREYPDRGQMNQVLHQRVACLKKLGRTEEALKACQDALAAERSFPNVQTSAYLDYGELVLALRKQELYDEALLTLAEFGKSEPFPVLAYRHAVIRAFIADERRDETMAKEWARRALAAADRTQSPFRHHQQLGLVGDQDHDVEVRLRRLAAGPSPHGRA